MANIVREDKEDLTAVLTVNLSKEDYAERVDSELRKLRKKVSLKGFRKGKTPISFVKKVYGKQVMAEAINNLLTEELTNYLKDNQIDILGQPLPVEEEEPDFDLNDGGDFKFHYELGLAPEVALKGISKKTTIERYDVEIDDELLEKETTRMRKQAGKSINPEEIGETDLVNLQVNELEDGEIKEGGIQRAISVSIDLIKTKKLMKQFIGMKKEETLDFNINQIEDRKPEDIRKIILGLKEDEKVNNEFRGKILNITRQEPAVMDQEFFDKVFGPGETSDEATFRGKLEENLKKYYDAQADGKMFEAIQKMLMEKNAINLPDSFLKKWLDASNENLDAEKIETEYDSFAENLKWSLIQGTATKKYELSVTDDELIASFEEGVQRYFGGNADPKTVRDLTQRMLEDQNTVNKRHEELIAEKLFNILKEKVKVADKTIHWKAFDELLSK